VSVTEPAVDGRATEAALRAVAEALGARRGSVTLVRGHASRDKVVVVDPAPPPVRARLQELMHGSSP
jgi:uncharacterized protein